MKQIALNKILSNLILFHEKLIPQGDHLIKGCQYWKKDVRVFAPEAA